MPTYILTNKFDACESHNILTGMHIRPHGLMRLDIDGSETSHAKKPYNKGNEKA